MIRDKSRWFGGSTYICSDCGTTKTPPWQRAHSWVHWSPIESQVVARASRSDLLVRRLASFWLTRTLPYAGGATSPARLRLWSFLAAIRQFVGYRLDRCSISCDIS